MPSHKINVHANHTLYFRHPGVRKNKPLAISTGANAIRWSYGLNTVVQPTFGGAVVQVLSTYADAMSVTGQTKDEDQLIDIYEWFKEYGQIAGLNHREERGVLFQYPERNWGFYIQPTTMPGFLKGVEKIAVDWTITAEIVADSAGDLNKATMSPFQGENKLFDPSLFSIGFTDRDPRSDPNADPRALDAAGNYADNFQGLLGAYASGDFAHWAYDVLARPKDNSINADSKSFWTQFLGSDFVAGNPPSTTATGSAVYSGGAPTTRSQTIMAINGTFESNGIPGKLGVAVAYIESGINANSRQSGGPGIGLFQASGDGSGRMSGSSELKLAFSHPGAPVIKYYSALHQVQDAASDQWFNNPSFRHPNDLVAWGIAAQAPGDPAYASKLRAALAEAPKWISDAQNAATHGSGTYGALASDSLHFAGPDQGLDFTGTGTLYAVADGRVTRVDRNSGWPGGTLIAIRLANPVHRAAINITATHVYYAEALVPHVKQGDTVRRGDIVATLDSSYPGSETGWAQDDNGSAYGSTTDGKNGNPAPYGTDFGNFVQSL